MASQLSNPVNAIFANAFAFAAVHDDGSVTTWGVSNNGGDSSSVDLSSSDRTRNIFTDEYGTFFAVKQSAKLVSWGGDSIPEQQLLNNDATVYSNMSSVVVNNNPFGIQCFGDVYRGGTCPSRAGTMNVKDIYYAFNSFLVVEYSGLPTVWGMNVDNYNLSDFLQPEHRVKHVATNVDGYAVLREDGTIIPIGVFSGEVDPSVINTGVKYTDVKDFRGQFIALREDGKALLWGDLIKRL
ncbi:hypothetical protein [Photobacterium leiognathi]|uniref:hypothetical protein n=1 Tax=Photobacterium leiognathi TaxID=553611 RepID=UPI002735DBD9|nr:hypothetical protein [Photobacterium leiognathi]